MRTQELTTIVTGMTICDVNGDHIGTVDQFVLGKEIAPGNDTSRQTIEASLKAIFTENEIPTDLNPQQYKHGYLYIECGFLQDNVIIFPHQIDDIEGEEIRLNLSKEELFTF